MTRTSIQLPLSRRCCPSTSTARGPERAPRAARGYARHRGHHPRGAQRRQQPAAHLHQAAPHAPLPQLRREEARLLRLQEAHGPDRRGRQHQADPRRPRRLGHHGRGRDPEGTTEESPSGVAARPSRRRGGRRRGSGQRDEDAADTDVADADADDDVVGSASDEEDIEDVVPGFVDTLVDTLEETAATDFDLPDAGDTVDSQPQAVASVEEDEEPVAWFDADEAVSAEQQATVEVASDPDPGPEEAAPEYVFGNDTELAAAIQGVVASIPLPDGPEDDRNPERVSDLIVMADHLEHRQGARHVAFSYLVNEVCDALEQGLEAGNPQIAQRWTGVGARDYVSRALRGLSDSGIFKRSIIAWREEDTGQRRQRRIINLVRDNGPGGPRSHRPARPQRQLNAPAEPPDETEAPPSPVGPEDSGETVTVALEEQPAVEQPSLADDNGAAEPADAVEPPPTPADEDTADDVYDEPSHAALDGAVPSPAASSAAEESPW